MVSKEGRVQKRIKILNPIDLEYMFIIAYLIGVIAAQTAKDDLVDPAIFSKYGIPFGEAMYSGYLPISEGKEFHYFFFPYSNFQKADDPPMPVLLWLNGGPGCSSLFGALVENGPFVFDLGTKNVRRNVYSWNNFASVIYLETPAGVGFSFGDTVSNDVDSAKDNLIALVQFFKRFPAYQNLDFYIAGESYAGIYIPNLANQIIDHNVNSEQKINLKGLLIGNGCTDPKECNAYDQFMLDFFGNHNMISRGLAQNIDQARDRCNKPDDEVPDDCWALEGQAFKELYANQNFYFNIYNVYGKCYTWERTEQLNRKHTRRVGRKQVPSCSEAEGMYWLLYQEDFKKAIHIKPESNPWEECANIEYTGDPEGTYYLYPKLITNGIRILKFSGDVDAVVPITGTLYWVDRLQREYGIPTLEAWRPWFLEGDDGTLQNAGNVLVLDGLTLATVRWAGHMVPMDQPAAAAVLASFFIFNEPLPSK